MLPVIILLLVWEFQDTASKPYDILFFTIAGVNVSIKVGMSDSS